MDAHPTALTLPPEAGKNIEVEDLRVVQGPEPGEWSASFEGVPAEGVDISAEKATARLAALLATFVKGHAFTIGRLQSLLASAMPEPGARFGFETALLVLKIGKRVRRAGWPASAFVAYQPGYPDGIPVNANTARAFGIPEGTVKKFGPYLVLSGDESEGGMSVPWSPPMIALLATDWQEAP
jgi:hypothetical protein